MLLDQAECGLKAIVKITERRSFSVIFECIAGIFKFAFAITCKRPPCTSPSCPLPDSSLAFPLNGIVGNEAFGEIKLAGAAACGCVIV